MGRESSQTRAIPHPESEANTEAKLEVIAEHETKEQIKEQAKKQAAARSDSFPNSPSSDRPPLVLADNTTLYIFPPSSGCETVIWLLERYGVSTTINCQTAPFFLFAIRLAGGETYPYFRVGDQGWSSSLQISSELENLVPIERSLYPRDPKFRSEATQEWTQFLNPKLGQAVPKWVYYWLLPHKNLLFKPLTKGVPWWQKPLVFLFYPIIAALIRKNLEIGNEIPKAEEQTIREVFDRVDERLADGRKYLMGDELSLIDIGFAGMAAPVVLEENYGRGGLLPTLDQVPKGMRPFVRELQGRPAGRFIARIYRDFR